MTNAIPDNDDILLNLRKAFGYKPHIDPPGKMLMGPFRFLDLPQELQDQIIEYAVPDTLQFCDTVETTAPDNYENGNGRSDLKLEWDNPEDFQAISSLLRVSKKTNQATQRAIRAVTSEKMTASWDYRNEIRPPSNPNPGWIKLPYEPYVAAPLRPQQTSGIPPSVWTHLQRLEVVVPIRVRTPGIVTGYYHLLGEVRMMFQRDTPRIWSLACYGFEESRSKMIGAESQLLGAVEEAIYRIQEEILAELLKGGLTRERMYEIIRFPYNHEKLQEIKDWVVSEQNCILDSFEEAATHLKCFGRKKND